MMKKIKFKHIVQIFIIILLLYPLQACREDIVDVPELDRSQKDINSYSDLFNTFWDTMNNDYNYFNEQQQNWDDVYRKYSPKFKALTTFNKSDAGPVLQTKEANLAFKYFADIIGGNILDEHFVVTVTIPIGNTLKNRRFTKYTNEYYGGEGFVSFKSKRPQKNPSIDKFSIVTVMKNKKLIPATIFYSFPLLAGFLKTDPETLYIIRSYSIFKNIFGEKSLENTFPLLKDISGLNYINQSFLTTLKNLGANNAALETQKLMNANLNDFKTLISTIITSNEYKAYLAALNTFKNTGLIDDYLQDSLKSLLAAIVRAKHNSHYNEYISDSYFGTSFEFNHLTKYRNNPNNTQAQKKAMEDLWHIYNKLIGNYQKISNLSGFNIKSEDKLKLKNIFNLYKKVYNPIISGRAKKIILDFRGNNGNESPNDVHQFIERFITQPKIWGYQRTKEGNGRFNYSPWIPIETKPHKFALKQNVPIAILIDEQSLGMTEVSTMMIKSQGNQVTIVGDNSGGGAAGLGSGDIYNGGNQLKNDYISFYMPLMAFKNDKGKVIESFGITPDIKVIPTQKQVDEYRSTGIDPAFNTALKAVNK